MLHERGLLYLSDNISPRAVPQSVDFPQRAGGEGRRLPILAWITRCEVQYIWLNKIRTVPILK